MPRIVIEIGEDYMTQLDERLKKYGISHGKLARATGIAETQLSRWFNGKHTPGLASIQKLEQGVLAIRTGTYRETTK